MTAAQQKASDDLVLELRGLFYKADRQLTVAVQTQNNLAEIQYQQERILLLQEILKELKS